MNPIMRRALRLVEFMLIGYAAFALIEGRRCEFAVAIGIFAFWALVDLAFFCRRPKDDDRTVLTLLAGALMIPAVALGLSAPAHADTSTDDWVAQNSWRVCMSLDNYPLYANIDWILNDLGTKGFDSKQRAEILVDSVAIGCPRHWPLLKAYIGAYTPQAKDGGRNV